MALPTSINNATPLGSASPATIDDQFRDLKLFLTDLFGVPNATNISANVMTVVAGGLDSINFANSGANAAVAGELQRNGANLTFHDGTSARTTVWAETTQTVSGNKTFSAGVWNGTAVGSQYGGTGQNTSANTGVPSISSGTWSVSSTLSPTLGGTGQNFSATAQGNTLYFSSAGTVAALSPGTSGYFLKTQGAGANPVWADATPADGSITTAKLADSSVTTAKISDSNVTTAKLADSSITTAKITDANITTAKLADSSVTPAKGGTGQNFSTTAQGSTLYFSGTGTVAALAPGTSGQFLKTQGAGANPAWANATDENQSANLVKSGPSSGAAAAPTYRALVQADLPATRFKVVSTTYDISTASGTLAITGSGFTPTACIVFTTINSAVTGSYGFAGTDKGAKGMQSVAGPVFNAMNGQILIVDQGGGANIIATISSYDSNGMTLSITKSGSPTGTATITVLFIL